MKTQAVKAKLLEYNTPRRVVQLLSFLLFSTIIFNLGVLPLLLPVLWTGGLIAGKGSTVGDAFTAIQLMFSGWGAAYAVFPWLALASFLTVGVLIGRSLCGWVCPFGFVQDLTGFIRRKQTDLSSRTHDNMVYTKYFVLAIALLIPVTFSAMSTVGVSLAYQSAFGIFAQAPFTAVSPSETLFSIVPKTIQSFHFSGLQNRGLRLSVRALDSASALLGSICDYDYCSCFCGLRSAKLVQVLLSAWGLLGYNEQVQFHRSAPRTLQVREGRLPRMRAGVSNPCSDTGAAMGEVQPPRMHLLHEMCRRVRTQGHQTDVPVTSQQNSAWSTLLSPEAL